MSRRRWPDYVYGVGTDPDPRFSFANERTFLAWIRTGLGFVAAGAAVGAISNYLPAERLQVLVAALVLVSAGVFTGVAGYVRWMRQERAMRLDQPLNASFAMPVLFVVLAVIAILTLTIL